MLMTRIIIWIYPKMQAGISKYAQWCPHAISNAMDEWRKRLADRMAEVGISAAQLARSAKIGPTMVHDILVRGANPSIQNLAKIAKALGTTVAFIYDGTQNNRPLSITIHGVNRGGDMFTTLPSNKSAVVPLEIIDENTVFIRIETDSFLPKFGPGDVIGGPRFMAKSADNFIGQEAIVCTADNAQFVRYVVRGTKPNRYNLRSFNPAHEDVRDVQLQWLAPIKVIFRA